MAAGAVDVSLSDEEMAALEAPYVPHAVAVFSIIFAPDPADAARGLVSTLRPGGRAVLSTWRPSA